MICKIQNVIRSIKEKKILRDWNRKGKPIPPPDTVKQKTVLWYAKKFSIDTLVETGTYLGDMVDATKNTFRKIFSIELDESLYKHAKNKFAEFEHISIIRGDSSKVLPAILADIKQPCLFWLDGHYSGGITAKGDFNTPIMQELNCILDHFIEEHVILIDDAREFNGHNDYPTLEELKKSIFKKYPDWKFDIKDDIIRIHK